MLVEFEYNVIVTIVKNIMNFVNYYASPKNR